MSSWFEGSSPAMPSPRKRTPISPGRLVIFGVLFCLALIYLAPFYLMVRNALMTQQQFAAQHTWIWFPWPLNGQSWTDLWTNQNANFAQGLVNSAILAVASVIGQTALASFAGYGLARIPSRWNTIVFSLILFSLMVPAAVTFVPTFLLVANLGWVNTYQGLIVPGLFNAFASLVFRQFYLDFPRELEEAATVDGLGYWGTYWRVVFPNARNIHLSLALLTFMTSWNLFLWPLVVGQDPSMWTVQIVISSFITSQSVNFPAVFMGALLSVIPLALVFFTLQRYIVAGLARTGIKG